MGKPTKAQLAEQEKAITELREMLPPGSTVFTKVTHVSQSGMSRSIEAYIVSVDDGYGKPDIHSISWLLAKLGIGTFDRKNGGIKMGGCGMDMTFELVYTLGRKLYPKGFETWPGYHRNTPLKFDTDGGYALHNRNI